MGCFDEFVPKKQDWKCWKCKMLLDKGMDLKKQAFQSKELGEHMKIFYEGKKIILQSSEIECSLGNGSINVYDYCEGCNKMNYFKIKIKNGIWVSTIQMNKIAQRRWNR